MREFVTVVVLCTALVDKGAVVVVNVLGRVVVTIGVVVVTGFVSGCGVLF